MDHLQLHSFFYDPTTGLKMASINTFSYGGNNCLAFNSYDSTGTNLGLQMLFGRDNSGYVLLSNPSINGPMTWSTDNDWDLGSPTSRPANIRVANTGYFYGLSAGIAQVNASHGLISSNALPTGTTAPNLNVNGSTQNTYKILLSGQEFYQAGNTDTNGIALLVGVNRTTNRQLWIADSAYLTQNSTNATLRIGVGGTNSPAIDALATDGATALPLTLCTSGGALNIGGTGATTFNGGAICYNGAQGTGYSTMPAIKKFYFTFTASNIPANSTIGSYHAYPTGKTAANLVSIQAYMYDGANFIGTNYLQSTGYAFSVAGNGSGIGLFTTSTWSQTTGTKTFYVWIECT
jgi:hypothetical protein